MKQTINEAQFIQQFKAIRPENFSYEGLKTIFEYLEDLEQDMGEEYELDVIAICCEFSEYENQEELEDEYGMSFEDIEDTTTVLITDSGSYIVQVF